ncbi:MAG: nucleoside deaminase [Magnetococcales bacterium]|nr:nucleoside deaminase [Magnetococcales bacterium]
MTGGETLYLEETQAALLLALVAAGAAGQQQEIPVGAVLQDAAGRFLGECGNSRIATSDPTGHAELRVMRQGAARIGHDRLLGTTLTVTLEPCPMCMAAAGMARVARLTYEAHNPLSSSVADALSRVVVAHKPAESPEAFVFICEENKWVGKKTADGTEKVVADAGLLLRIFFDQKRKICSNASSRCKASPAPDSVER